MIVKSVYIQLRKAAEGPRLRDLWKREAPFTAAPSNGAIVSETDTKSDMQETSEHSDIGSDSDTHNANQNSSCHDDNISCHGDSNGYHDNISKVRENLCLIDQSSAV